MPAVALAIAGFLFIILILISVIRLKSLHFLILKTDSVAVLLPDSVLPRFGIWIPWGNTPSDEG